MTAADKVRLRDRFRFLLVAEQEKRRERDEWVDKVGPAWVLAERWAMWTAVNGELLARGTTPVPVAAIERVENFAAGHSDYTALFALGCAEIVVGERDRDGGLVTPEAAR